MLELSIIEIIFRTIPEGFLFILAGYAFSATKLDVKRYIISGSILGIGGSLIRFLPINFGVHSLLIIIVFIILLNQLNKIPILRATSSVLIVMILGFACESLNALFIQNVLGKDLDIIFANPIQKVLYGLPSLVLMGSVAVLAYFIMIRRKEKSDVSTREDIE